jgi:hypothetical protein
MAGKNKGGREIRKPKQDKKAKAAAAQSSTVLPPSPHSSKAPQPK